MNDNSFINFKLVSPSLIHCYILSSFRSDDFPSFYLIKDGSESTKLNIKKTTSIGHQYHYELEILDSFEYGHSYKVMYCNLGLFPLDVSNSIGFVGFEDNFFYSGDDLGSTYFKSFTSFAVWAPIASKAFVKIIKGKNAQIYEMKREEKGVYRAKIKGDFKNCLYHYIVINSEISYEVNDPYGKGLSLNSLYSAVIDFESINSEIKKVDLVSPKKISQTSIYELSIRDFTISKLTNIENKGKYLGLIEENRKTVDGFPAGIDYLKFLGISHVQLLPILDFARVKDDDPLSSYNWGYDPLTFFALEGSYSSNPLDPESRIKEVKILVNSLHKANIGVNLDLVFNHIYDFPLSCFNKIVPNYFFRKNKDGSFSSGSGCGCDVDTQKKMVRKILVDSTIYLIKEFDVDGFRFDLMGLIDIDTIKIIYEEAKKLKPDFMFYGEGWDIVSGDLKSEDRTTIYNCFKLPGIGFFNDTFRDLVKGNCFDLSSKGFASGDTSYAGGMGFGIYGCLVDYAYSARFYSADQVINYIECHDNHTLYDKLKLSLPFEEDEMILKRVNFANALTIFSFGIPFIHMGQELGLSKYGKDNTYIAGDRYNKMQYDKLKTRFFMSSFVKGAIEVRRMLSFFDLTSKEDIEKAISINYNDEGIIFIDVHKAYLPSNFSSLKMFINPNTYNYSIKLDDYYKELFSIGGKAKEDDVHFKIASIPGLCFYIIYN